MSKTKRLIYLVVGARPNYMKAAPIARALRRFRLPYKLIHTGQHYSKTLAQDIFRDLGIRPHINLKVGSGTHAEQTAKVLIRFERLLLRARPDVVVVVGDVNSTLACSLAAAKLHIPVMHVEAGLRSFDRLMPEELNRLLTDQLSDILFTTSPEANLQLRKEGIPRKKIVYAGNVMIDSLFHALPKAKHIKRWKKHGLKQGQYALVTLHRPSNVDDKRIFTGIVDELICLSKQIPVLWPVHPRALTQLKKFKLRLLIRKNRIRLVQAEKYMNFLSLMISAKMILTDSGGIQEEASVLNIPCLTLRNNTERPITITHGSNILVGNTKKKIRFAWKKILKQTKPKRHRLPKTWDGHAAKRIVQKISTFIRQLS